jgi:hypothetical protein
MDWEFTIWQTESWQRQKKMPVALSAFRHGDSEESPVPEMRFYAGGSIDWKDVIVPKGIEVVDKRLQSRGFTIQDGRVLEGRITEFGTGRPVAGTIMLESIHPKATGGYDHQLVSETKTDGDGKWTCKNIGAQGCRVVARAPGYAPRIITYISKESEPGWDESNTQLAKIGLITGVVKDELDRPLSEVDVSLRDVALPMLGIYECPDALECKTDKDGKFSIAAASGASGRLRVHRDGYCRLGVPAAIQIPGSGMEIPMTKSASLIIQVEFEGGRKDGDYVVQVESAAQEKLGTWGASSSLGPDNTLRYHDVPPGTYLVHGRPNPGSEKETSKTIKIELSGGKESTVVITAKP